MQGDPLRDMPFEGQVFIVIKCPPAGRKDLQQKKLQSKQVMQQSVCALMTQRYVASCPGIRCCTVLVHSIYWESLAMLYVSHRKCRAPHSKSPCSFAGPCCFWLQSCRV